ncbi:MAG TPA: hypothetical protein VMV69_17400 [Pirellulales bacterium]|nr:hypothetical protein [Pirellulales bacterium]
MLRLHETLRRRVCRASFCLLCVLPTAGLLGFSASRTHPSHTRRCESELSDLLGLRAKLAVVRYPRPGVTLYEGLELADPETGECALRCPWLEFESVDGRVLLSATRPEIETARLKLLWELLMRRLRRELATDGEVRLSPCQVTLRASRGSQTYDVTQALVEHVDQGEAIEIRFRPTGADDSEPAAFRVVRERSQAVPFTRLEIMTYASELPVSIFAPLADVEAWLGGDSRFAGSFWIDELADGWKADMTGQLRGVDLQSLIGDRFPHQLNGPADIEIDRALFDRGRLTEADGSFSAGPGTIGTSLLDAAVESLELEPGQFNRTRKTALAFEELAFRFHVDAGGLVIAGACRGAPSRGVVLVGSNDRVLLASPREGSLPPVIGIIRMLVPQSEVRVPATRETAGLLQVLPVPPIVPRNDGARERPPEGRLRLAPSREAP